MTGPIFTDLSTLLKTKVVDANNKPIFKNVELWNNQPEHWLKEENDDKPRLLPACFIEFSEVQNKGQLNKKTLQKDFKTVLHIVYESLKDNDATYLDTKQKTYKYVQWFEADTCSKFRWDGELFNNDYGNLRWCQQIYSSTLKDFAAVDTPNSGTVANMTTTPLIVPNI